MRRTSVRAKQLAAAADISCRQVESWSQQGLGPSADSPNEIADHFRALSAVVQPGRGHSPDEAALRMASRGYPCARLRQALLVAMDISTDPFPTQALDLSDDATFAALEQQIAAMVPLGDSAPPVLRPFFVGMQRAIGQSLGIGPAAGNDMLQRSLLNIASSLAGEGVFDAVPVAALLGISEEAVDERSVDRINEIFSLDLANISAVYRLEDLTHIVVVAAWLHGHVKAALAALPTIEIPDSSVEVLTTLASPLAICFLRCLRAHATWGEPVLAQLALPQPVAVATPAAS